MALRPHLPPTVDPAAQPAFDATVRAIGRDPADPWIGGYVAYEWRHLRAVLGAYDLAMVRPDGTPLRVLEFGSNVGASAVVMATLGAQVTGVDIDADYVRIAQANAALHGLTDRISIVHCADTRALPFNDGSFDLILANSVLEYVASDQLPDVVRALHRVSAANSHLLITGTASRLAPQEVHSKRWLVNYWPEALDRLIAGQPLQRGLAPWTLARAMSDRFRVVDPSRWLACRRAIHRQPRLSMYLLAGLTRPFGIAPGWLSPHIELLARRMD
jgi:SAM-dependent methyltransferase